ncbi:hypothetical protein EJ08DRAFT_646425 [Tothia fuscella]|uniref:Uncharacterized protein n=1 Tax=Tothia fuscella TaxID=1048955 RepID=A0A9P4P063_9PEZI|nr:hypothetical protein EJ08DRAFT_646425 [Tothia fuscella]
MLTRTNIRLMQFILGGTLPMVPILATNLYTFVALDNKAKDLKYEIKSLREDLRTSSEELKTELQTISLRVQTIENQFQPQNDLPCDSPACCSAWAEHFAQMERLQMEKAFRTPRV